VNIKKGGIATQRIVKPKIFTFFYDLGGYLTAGGLVSIPVTLNGVLYRLIYKCTIFIEYSFKLSL
jgi:hypothetical protein